MKPRIVIDTNVIVTALKSSRGASNKLLQLFGSDRFISNISVALVIEYEAVIKRLLPHLTEEKINDFLDYVCTVSQHIKIHFLWRPHLRDPKDDMVLEVAVASEADFIVTYNMKDFKSTGDFGIEVITPKELLVLIGELS